MAAGSVTDAVFLLSYNFLGGRAPPCFAACDANADGRVAGGVTDAIYLLSFSFLGTVPPPPAPFPACGCSSAPGDVALGCELTSVGCAGAAPCLRQPVLEVLIVEPRRGAYLGRTPVAVSGTVRHAQGEVTVEVDGIPAGVTGESWTAQVPLREGARTLTATARDARGNNASASVDVNLDQTPPIVAVKWPSPGFVTVDPSITVTGLVHDVVDGTVNREQAMVLVQGREARVANRCFSALIGPLSPGSNQIRVEARDPAENVATTEVEVIFEDPAGKAFLRAAAGDRQTGPVGGELPEPLVAAVRDAAGAAVRSKAVVFKVVENNGVLSRGPAGPGQRSLAVTTDAGGLARVFWTLGTRAGTANNRVEAHAVGLLGTAVFTATALPLPAHKISLDMGSNQTGEVEKPLFDHFQVVVTDSTHNRLPLVPVTFRVVRGGGNLEGQTETTVVTDSDGMATAVLTLGPEAGDENNVVTADFAGNSGSPVTFTASARFAGDPAATRVSGVVLDNSDRPVAGVLMSIAGTDISAYTDEQGQFLLEPAPVGRILLVGDGNTTSRGGAWPELEYEMTTVAGADNTPGMPIYLLPLDLENGLRVDETRGGTLTLPQVPGFALAVAPGSATFPDGRRSGLVSVTLVHSDKVPMVPAFGQQPRFIVTIQPAGVRFDPPAPMTIPNVDGLKPGEVTEMYSFDHDLNQFVSIGPGTVSDDGAVLQSDAGVGIVKGGWHCGGNPSPAGGAEGAHVEIIGIARVADEEVIKVLAGSRSPRVEINGPEEDEARNRYQVSFFGGPIPGGTVLPPPSDRPDIAAVDQTIELGPGRYAAFLVVKKPGTARITFAWRCPSGALASVILVVVVRPLDLDLQDIPEDLEDDPGAFVDAEKADGAPRPPLRKLLLRVGGGESFPEGGDTRINLGFIAHEGGVKVYRDPGRGEEVPLPATWDLGETPEELWVAVSRRALEVPARVMLMATATGASPELEDSVRLTVPVVDLRFPGLSEAREDDTVIFVGKNDDDDNGNGIEDFADRGAGYLIDEELRLFRVSVSEPVTGTATLRVSPPMSVYTESGARSVIDGLMASKPSLKVLTGPERDAAYLLEGLSATDPVAKSLRIEFDPMVGGVALGPRRQDELKVLVVEADLDLEDISEADEESAGGEVLNVSDEVAATGEKLTELKLNVRPFGIAGSSDLSFILRVFEGSSKVKIRELRGPVGNQEAPELPLGPDGTIALPAGAFPRSLYVQGTQASDEREVAIELCVVARDPALGSRRVHCDRIRLTVVGGELHLRPVLIPIVGALSTEAFGTKQLRATVDDPNSPDGERDVTADEDIEYTWVFKGVPYEDISAVVKGLQEHLGTGLGVADIDVSAEGLLTVRSAGVQLVRARLGDEESNWSVVLAGLELAEIDLQPRFPPPTSLLSTALNLASRLAKNPPLFLVADDNALLADKGRISLEDVTFQFLGDENLKISASQLHRVLNLVIGKFIKTNPLTVAIKWLVTYSVKFAATSAVDFTSSDAEVVTIPTVFGFSIGGIVQAHAPGIAGVKGVLDLGSWGKAEDTVFVFVLPDLESVEVDPPETLIYTTDPREPGPSVRAFGTFLLGRAAKEIEVKGKASKAAQEILDQVLPGGLADFAQGSIDYSFQVGGFRGRVQGSAGLVEEVDGEEKKLSLVFSNVRVGFHLPLVIPFVPGAVQNALLTSEWSIDPLRNPNGTTVNLATLGEQTGFDQHVLRRADGEDGESLRTGETTIRVMVAASGMGEAMGTGKLVIREYPVESIAVTPVLKSIQAGDLVQYTAIATLTNGDTINVTNRSLWATGDFSIAAIDRFGLAEGVKEGETTVAALYQDVISNDAILKVTELTAILVLPATKTIRVEDEAQYQAIGIYVGGRREDITHLVTWSSSAPNIASISSGPARRGLATGVARGQTLIRAALKEITSDPATLTVADLVAIEVAPARARIPVDSSQAYTATGIFSDGSREDLTGEVRWSSSDPLTAPIDGRGVAEGLEPGLTFISAALEEVRSNNAILEVYAELLALTVTPASAVIEIDAVLQYSATGEYSDGTFRDVSGEVAWSSSAPGIATIAAGGLARGRAEGQTRIRASLDGVSSNDAVLDVIGVLLAITVTPAGASIRLDRGETVQYRAMGQFQGNVVKDITGLVVWASSAPSVAAIARGGLARGVSPGGASISASFEDVTSNAVELRVFDLVAIAVSPQSASIRVGGQKLQYTATGTFSDREREIVENITGRAAWFSTKPDIATISGAGLAAGIARGETNITASLRSVTSNTAVLKVTAPKPPGIKLLINEVVAHPWRDWNDSGGGNGVPFDATPGPGVRPSPAVDAGDTWVEVVSVGNLLVVLNGWTLQYRDAAGADVVIPLPDVPLAAGGHLVVGSLGAIPPDAVLRLREASGEAEDEAPLGDIQAALGPATGVANEAIARIPSGLDTAAVTDFQRRPATIGRANQ